MYYYAVKNNRTIVAEFDNADEAVEFIEKSKVYLDLYDEKEINNL